MAPWIVSIPHGRGRFHHLGPVAAGAFVLGLALLSTGPVLGSAPPGHKVTICHATPPDTAAHGWHAITVDVASVGYRHAGHESRHDADIIPPYTYGESSYAGKNWTPRGQAIWANGCRAVEPTEAPTATPTEGSAATPTPTPSGEVLPTATTNATSTPTATPTGEVGPATGTPGVTLPPTDMAGGPAGGASSMALAMVMSLLALGSLAGLAVAGWAGRRSG